MTPQELLASAEERLSSSSQIGETLQNIVDVFSLDLGVEVAIVPSELVDAEPTGAPSRFLNMIREGKGAGGHAMEMNGRTLGTIHLNPDDSDDLTERLVARCARALDYAWLEERSKAVTSQHEIVRRQFDHLIKANIVGVIVSNLRGEVQDANDKFLSMIGTSREQMERGGVNWQSLTPEEHLASTQVAIDQVRFFGHCEPFEKEYFRSDGTRVPVMVVSTRMDLEGDGVMSLILDMSHERRIEGLQRSLNDATRILASSLHYEETLAQLAEFLVGQFADWCALYTLEKSGPKLVTLCHRDPELVNWALTIPGLKDVSLDDATGVGRVMRTGQHETYSIIRSETFETWFGVEHIDEILEKAEARSAMLIPMKARNEVVGALVLVGSREQQFSEANLWTGLELANRAAMAVDNARLFRDVERQVEERTEQLREANRELESFAYSVSHDLRSPLRSIMSASMILMEDYADKLDEEAVGELKRSSAAAKRMSNLIDDLLEFSRLGRREMKVQSVDLSSLAESVARDAGIPPEACSIQPEMMVEGDPDLLRVVLVNLVENAWKFAARVPEPHVRIGVREEAGECVYFVEDNGVGFDEQYADKLFVPFERLHNPQDYPGSGIGLANVRRIILRHHGRVWGNGKVGDGATFSFTLGASD